MEGERMSFDEKTGRFEALGSFADMMKSLSMHLHDPNPEVALRSRMLMAMMPGLDEAMKEEARRQTPATSVAIAGLDVATTFLGNMVRHMTDDEKDVPKGSASSARPCRTICAAPLSWSRRIFAGRADQEIKMPPIDPPIRWKDNTA
jgi:hypothetical protein